MDLSKAFNTLYHNIVLHKLNHYGIKGVEINYISVDVFKKRRKTHLSIYIINSYSMFSHTLQSFYFVIVDMYI